MESAENLDRRVVSGFGVEWSRFSNECLEADELREMFELYTSEFPWEDLPDDSVGFDAGCGSGRWARFFASRVGWLHCVDASEAALRVARSALTECSNVEFHHEDLSSMGLEDASCDFGYSLGVLHHIPNSEQALGACVEKLKPGAPFLVYVYHDLGSGRWVHRRLLDAVTMARFVISRFPSRIRSTATDAIAVLLYWPLARCARLYEGLGGDPSFIPLFQYRNRSLYVMRNDSLDRFGTRLEKRYSREEVVVLLEGAGLENTVFSEGPPWWVAVAWRRSDLS